MRVLVTGGAGYIGSCVSQYLIDKGDKVIIIDNLSTGLKTNIPKRSRFYKCNIQDTKKINKILSKNKKNYYEIIKVFKKYKQIEFRKIPLKSSPLHDCIIFNFKNKKLSKKFVEIINNQGLVTKNVPDAIEWHFAMYWDHIFKRFGINKKRLKIILKKSHDLLERSVSIPIFVNDTNKKIKAKKKIFDEALRQVL